jgi:hypothetical protein
MADTVPPQLKAVAAATGVVTGPCGVDYAMVHHACNDSHAAPGTSPTEECMSGLV